MNKLTQLQCLRDGDRFEIPSLKHIMRKLRVIRIGSGSALIKGERKNEGDDESWQHFEYCISLTTPVIYLSTNDDNELEEKAVEEKVAEEKKKGKNKKRVEEDESAKKNGRGRPSKNLSIKFPDGDWTIGEVAEMNGCEKYDIVNYIKRQNSQGNLLNIIENGVRKSGEKGKPSKLYRLS
jgi:hypothetical protein